jgi:hypothetical protein
MQASACVVLIFAKRTAHRLKPVLPNPFAHCSVNRHEIRSALKIQQVLARNAANLAQYTSQIPGVASSTK